MLRRIAVMASWLEIIVGVSLVTAPALLCVLLFAAKPEGTGVPLARFAGFGLLALGISCLPSTPTASRRGVTALLVFNAGVTILFAWVGFTAVHGFLLWPVVILHGAIATTLVAQYRSIKGG